MAHLQRAVTRSAVLIAIAVLVLIIAVVRFTSCSGTHSDAPSDHYIKFFCENCKKPMEVSDRDFEKMFDRREFKVSPDGRTQLYKCKNCGEFKAVRVIGSGAAPAPQPGSGARP